MFRTSGLNHLGVWVNQAVWEGVERLVTRAAAELQARTPPLPCVSSAFVTKMLPLPRVLLQAAAVAAAEEATMFLEDRAAQVHRTWPGFHLPAFH